MCHARSRVGRNMLNKVFHIWRDCVESVYTLGDKVTAALACLSTATAAVALVVIRSHWGHMDKVEAGSGSELWGDNTVGGPTFKALRSSTSLWSLLFCSVRDPNHLFKYSHSISVCFNLLLYKYSTHALTLLLLKNGYCKFATMTKIKMMIT